MRALRRLGAARPGDAETARTVELEAARLPATIDATLPPMPATPEPACITTLHPRDPARYRIIAEHGRGGLGRVTRVHDRELGRDIAIKELWARDPQRESRFLREALITARLEHPGIVPVHEAGRWPDGTPFYAMKLVSGRPLRELILECGVIEHRLGLLDYVIAVADAIAYAHDQQIIHRDLKPENVIIGKFGEAVVIDWGLAKDLTSSAIDEAGPESAASVTEGLTQAGAILGTLAYMSPEQRRGEQVDQRADVYAIGVMLWELCTCERLSLVEPAGRRQVLRGAGIDDDLIAIIVKALHPELHGRYPHAAALTADLKAFKAGARIRARHYSPLAMLAHWVRRHRTLSLAMTAAVALSMTGGAVYVQNIALERDRADDALARVELTQAELGREHADLTLKHAQLLMASDPSAALDTLAAYHGSEGNAVDQLRAEASIRGVALVRAAPHTSNLIWAAGMPDGRIASIGLDGTIVKTSPHGGVVLANDMTPGVVYAYAKSRQLLVYLCRSTTLCFLDVLRGLRLHAAPEPLAMPIVGVALSASGNHLAVLVRGGELRLFDITDLSHVTPLLINATDRGATIRFLGEDAIVVGATDGGQLVHMTGQKQSFSVPGGTLRDVQDSTSRALFVAQGGEGWLVDLHSAQPTMVRQQLCQSSLTDLKFLPGAPTVAYSCKDGTVGLWEASRRSVTARMHLDSSADGLAVSSTGEYLIAASGKGVIALLDLATGLVAYYRGHAFRLIALAGPTPEYPYILSGDVRGGLRAWPLPQRYAHVVAELPYPVISAIASPYENSIVVAAYQQPRLIVASGTERESLRVVEPHAAENSNLREATNHHWFAAFGFGDKVELWSTWPIARRAVLDTHHGTVSQVLFADDGESLVTAGEDGKLLQWTIAGEPHLVAGFGQPITVFALASATKVAVVSTAGGGLWQITKDGHVVPLRTGAAKPLHMLTLPDGISVCIDFADGEVSVVDTRSGRMALLTRVNDAVREVASTSDGQMIAIAVDDGTVRVGIRKSNGWFEPGTTWTTLSLRARKLALTSDGLLVAACTDGIIWLWSATHRSWLGLATDAAPSTMVISPDSRTATTLDNRGGVISIDLESARKILNSVH